MGENNKENFLVTGGSGYVGKLLIHKLINDARVDNIVVIDRDDLKADLKNSPKVYFVHKNLVDDWQDEVKSTEEKNNFKITKVIHLAWHIRTIYGNKKLQNHWNIGGSQKVFDWVKNNPNISSLVHFSTVASYGALPSNTFEKYFLETDKFIKSDYLYAEEKRIVEENLEKVFMQTSGGLQVFVIRPASITGPVGRERTGFGLQSALSGKIKNENLLFKLIAYVLQFMPATRGWARQFIHEDDIVNASVVMSFLPHPTSPYKGEESSTIRKYNLCPSGGYIDAREMGQLLGKRVVYLHPQIVRFLCFWAWHLTRGKIPTSAGVWKAYAYPINVDGTKMERDFADFKYSKNIREAYSKDK